MTDLKIVGICIDAWKLPIFKKHLDKGGYSYTEHPGLSVDIILLKVMTTQIATLQPIIEKANKECRSFQP